jgi:hypothetical protein
MSVRRVRSLCGLNMLGMMTKMKIERRQHLHIHQNHVEKIVRAHFDCHLAFIKEGGLIDVVGEKRFKVTAELEGLSRAGSFVGQ